MEAKQLRNKEIKPRNQGIPLFKIIISKLLDYFPIIPSVLGFMHAGSTRILKASHLILI